ncbi:MAG: sugar ABC transporter ATP-binding protein [Ruminiclostridium sp.]
MDDIILRVEHVSKSYGATQALKDVNFTVRRGTIHSLLGRNGAGKSTVVNIIAGIHKQNEGNVLLEEKDVTPYSVFERQEMGIRIVPQHASIIPDLTVGENIFMGIWPKNKNGFVSWERLFIEARVELEKYKLNVDLKEKVRNLNGVDQRKVNIIRAMYGGAKLIILDEPTTALTSVEREDLFSFVNDLKTKGTAFIFISHYLQEVVDLSDEVTVIRDGLSFSGSDGGSYNEEKLANLIAGEEVELVKRTNSKKPAETDIVLDCKNLSGAILDDVSLKLYKGEITGVVGFPGSGARELCRSLFGLERINNGKILLNGKKEIKISSPNTAMKNGIAYLPCDRHKEGFVGLMTISENISIPLFKTTLRTKYGFINKVKANLLAQKYFEMLKIKANTIFDKLNSLSGGNQQKVVVAKTLAVDPTILMLDEPTIGIDIKSREEIIENIDRLTNTKQISVLYLTNDFDELIRIVDRILFFQDGKLMRDVYNKDLTHEDIIKIRDEVKEQSQQNAKKK